MTTMTLTMSDVSGESFETVAWPHRGALYRLALRFARRPDVAEDLVQDTFVNAFRSFDSFQPGTNARAWLMQILRRTFISRYRAEKARGAGDERRGIDGLEADGANPEATVMSARLHPELHDALEELPASFREAVTYAWLDELTYQEIAERLGVPIGTVMSRIYRGRKLLQERLKEFGAARRLVVAEGDGRLAA